MENENILTLREALQLFDDYANNDDMAYYEVYDGCYQRAHIICEDLKQMGYVSKKAWASSKTTSAHSMVVWRPDLTFNLGTHVAPVTPVLMPSGKIVDLVIDPLLFDGPATLAEFHTALYLKQPDGKVEVLAPDQAPSFQEGSYMFHVDVDDQTTDMAKADLAELARRKQNAYEHRIVFRSKARMLVATTLTQEEKADFFKGNGWRSQSSDTLSRSPERGFRPHL